MRVATTKHGKKLHLIDHEKPLDHTICGVKKFGFLEIKRPRKTDTCQSCVKAMFARWSKLLVGTYVVGKPVKPGKSTTIGEIRPRGSSSQVDLSGVQAKGQPLTEGKTKHVQKPRNP